MGHLPVLVLSHITLELPSNHPKIGLIIELDKSLIYAYNKKSLDKTKNHGHTYNAKRTQAASATC